MNLIMNSAKHVNLVQHVEPSHVTSKNPNTTFNFLWRAGGAIYIPVEIFWSTIACMNKSIILAIVSFAAGALCMRLFNVLF